MGRAKESERVANIVEMQFGSHLYGLNTPDSDMDFKGIFMPRTDEILLGRIPKTWSSSSNPTNEKNQAGDTDFEIYSLHYFVELALQGQTVALDMLHAPESAIIHETEIWRQLVDIRHRFYTRDLTALVGYARKQAAKYGIKGSRLAAAKTVLSAMQEVADAYGDDIRLGDADAVWDCVVCEHVHDVRDGENRFLQVCGKKLQSTARLRYLIPILDKFCQEYGERARQAERSEGVDWKAMSHALRAGYQVKQILENGGFEYPLPETDFLKAVKLGHFRYKYVAWELETLLDELEKLRAQSDLPSKPDRGWVEDWLIGVTHRKVAVLP